MEREYLRVTPTSEELGTNGIVEVLSSLHKLSTTSETGLLSKLNPLNSSEPPRFEFLAISEGTDRPVEFYYGATEHLDTLESRLLSIYPSTFDIERTELDPAQKLIPEREYTREEFEEALEAGQLWDEFDEHDEDDDLAESDEQEHEVDSEPVHARPSIDQLQPVGVQWRGTAERKRDWMTTLVPFTKATAGEDAGAEITITPLSTLIEHLSDFDHPIGFQVVFQRRPEWKADAELRVEDLKDGRDTFAQRYIGPIFEFDDYDYEDRRRRRERNLPDSVQDRIDRITAKRPKKTYSVNLRTVAVPPVDADTDDLASQLASIPPVFDPLDGPFYGLNGRRTEHKGWFKWTRRKNARKHLRNVLNCELTTSWRKKKTRPDLILNADELANFLLVPSGEQLSVEGARGTRAEQQSRNPLPRPHQDLMGEFRDGMAIGYALDGNREPEDVPVCIPPDLLTTHYGRFGTTGAGKSKAFINEILSLHENTKGPVIAIEPKGDGMAENYMRAHARRFGTTDLEENVIHFPIPDVLPGFSFFNIKPALENGSRRTDAVQQKANHYEEILKLAVGTDKYDSAISSPTLIKVLIKALFDEQHGRENGLYRESADYFAHRQLEYAVDQLTRAGPPTPTFEDLPKSSNEEVTRLLRRLLELDPASFSMRVSGIGSRLAHLSLDTNLLPMFNNTEPRFDFRDILDEDKIILLDLGELSGEASRLVTGVVFSNLYEALKERRRKVNDYPDDYVVNLFVDEASSVVVSGLMNDLLEKGRAFRLSVGLSMQYPEQIEAEGGRKVYLNTLNNIGSSLVGQISVDRKLAQAMSHEGMGPEEFTNRIGSLPRGEWIAKLPSPNFKQTGPFPLSLEPLPIPAGHPESDYPLSEREEEEFKETLSTMHKRAKNEFGVSESSAPSTQTPEELQEVLSVTDDELDVVLAKVVRSIQLQNDVREENGWVAVEAVDDELRRLFTEVEAEVPSYDELASIRKRSRLLETEIDVDADEVIIQLSAAGEDVSTPDTGDVRSAGGDDHDGALLEVEEELSKLGFTVSILSQDGSEMPDARATHPELEETFAIEVETTTPGKPAKVLTNLRKAQEEGSFPVFVVRPGDTETYWAERVENILSPPIRELADGETWFYTYDSPLMFNGGATEQGGVTAVRPVNGGDDQRRTVWALEDDSIVLRDGSGTEYLRASERPSVTKERVPATYSYDPAVDKYLVYGRGETHVYESKDAFESEWVKIKEPFIPENELPNPTYDTDDYATVILSEDDEAVVYDGGSRKPLDSLLENAHVEDLAETKENREQSEPHSDTSSEPTLETGWKDDPDAVVEQFVTEWIVEDEHSSVPAAEVYSTYEMWAEQHQISPDSKSWFSRRLNNQIVFERSTERRNGEVVRSYNGITLENLSKR
ncbi:conjugation protein [Haloferax prahovense DSM 18310]|uniref:Conjugation protein n=1 Tax=Haloferax prahovense (strain DSM 18310 / JCM 13924 / TL6) TaxID=1227461 RepID=M0GAI9_HALPT|nr:hypothetical protein [Haloferax prahovense]ELZ68543.1 conjugation protein [Haloferax prahovense DSM 18310]